MGAKSTAVLLSAGLALALAACGTGGAGALSSMQRAASQFTLRVIHDAALADSTAQDYALAVEETSAGVVVSVNATGAQHLKALYFELDYDATLYTPVAVEATTAMGQAEDLLRLEVFKEPGLVTYGQVLAGWEQRAGFSGDATLARVTFAPAPATVLRLASTAPGDAHSAPTLAWDSATGTLSWYYRNTGDYSQNLLIGIEDLTPLGVHINDAAVIPLKYGEATIQSVVDGDNSGGITIGDLTPIGVNWKKSLAGGYNVYRSSDTADYPPPAAAPFTGAVDSAHLLANVPPAAFTGAPGGQRLACQYVVTAPVAGDCYWVRPNDAAGGAGMDGTPSNLIITPSGNDGIYTQDGGEAALSGKAYSTAADDTSGVHVYNAGTFTLSQSSITTSGGTSSMDDSSFIGLNAAVLAETGATINLEDCTINTSGTGANGLFAYGAGSVATMSGGSIVTTQGGAHGVDATGGGSLTITDVDITTSGNQAAAAISTDRGGGTIHATGGTVRTSGSMSPTVYSTGDITVTNASLTATNCEGTTMDGNNSITLNNCTLVAAKQGCKFMNTVPSGMTPGAAAIVVNGGSLTAQGGDLFYILGTNSLTVNITVQGGAVLAASTGILVDATTGAVVVFTATGELLSGNLVADGASTLTASLAGGTTLAGLITNAGLSLDAASSWTVTGDSVLTTFSDTGGISGTALTNVYGNGHTVTYDATLAANSALGGQTYTLSGGGVLTPAT